MTITSTKNLLIAPAASATNDLFDPHLWADLAQEYLVQLGMGLSDQARLNGMELMAHVKRSTRMDFIDGYGSIYVRGGRGVVQSTWLPVADAEPYADFAAMRAAFEADRGGMLVSSEYCDDHPVFSPEVNQRFRAWHDAGHLAYGFGFSPNDEIRLFQRNLWAAEAAHPAKPGMSHGAQLALFSESIYQLAASVVLGDFPPTQTVAELGPVGLDVFDWLRTEGGGSFEM